MLLNEQIDVGSTGPAYKIELVAGKEYKSYVPRKSPAAVAASKGGAENEVG